ncbi:hypothetical protein F4803DRAFT_534728 [Xylaria telfairii]|nr:hypothetical protein F4803DRAFT_534728 [Xylaria telfairii]
MPTSQSGFTITYRPPEIDIEGGKLSQASDIWNFGCVLSEMACWMLGGSDLLKAFNLARLTMGNGAMRTDNFFSVVELENGKRYNFMVKKEVADFIQRLHEHERCTEYIHRLLDLLERKMIVVQTDSAKRTSSGNLRKELGKIHQQVEDDKNKEYILKPVPGPRSTSTSNWTCYRSQDQSL